MDSRITGLYGMADAGASGGDPLRLGQQLLRGGCRLIQLRCKDWSVSDIERAGRELVRLASPYGATVLINDYPELVQPTGAHGVHVGQLDASAEAVRALAGPRAIVGRSTHDPNQVILAARDADYVAYGPVFETPNISRPKPVRGLQRLAAIRPLIRCPLVAIGGITLERLPAVRATGIDSWAVIGAIATASDPVKETTRWLAVPHDPAS